MSFVRNRAAHLEPLFRRSIHRDVKDARMLMGWIDPQARAWFDDTVQIDNILADTPAFLR